MKVDPSPPSMVARAGLTRREFARLGLAAALTATTASRLEASSPPRSRELLILGGTGSLGPHQVASAVERGHDVTVFNRGRSQPTTHRRLLERIETLMGDRAGSLEALAGRRWDAVIDNSGLLSAWVGRSANYLKEQVDRYVFLSSIGVYAPYVGSSIDETTPVRALLQPSEAAAEPRPGSGLEKARGEQEVVRAFGAERSLILRPTQLMGPGDRNDRLVYWPVRLAMGGEVLIPGRVDDPVQYLDIRDLAEWTIRLVEAGVGGTLNAAGPGSAMGIQRFVHGVAAASSASSSFVQVSDYEFLQRHGLGSMSPWRAPIGNAQAFARMDITEAVQHGLHHRPLADSISDLHDWWLSESVGQSRRDRLVHRDGSLFERERNALAQWNAERGLRL